jgi:hypothetical protein
MLQVFNQFLSAKERIPEKNIPYYVKWVSDCYRYFDKPETQLLTNDQNAKFLNHLAKKYEDWQVQQADRALRLYGYFLNRMQRNEDVTSGDKPGDWKKIEEKTRKKPMGSGLELSVYSLFPPHNYLLFSCYFNKLSSENHFLL